MIRIKSEGGIGFGTVLITDGGMPVEGIQEIKVRIAANDLVTAEIAICVDVVDVLAHPLLTLETLEAAAAARGLKLVPA